MKINFDLILNTSSEIHNNFNEDEIEWLIELLKKENKNDN